MVNILDNNKIIIEDFIQEHETLISYRGNDGEIDWESKNEINTSIKLSLQIFFPNSEFKKIKDFEKKLNEIELVNSFSIKEFNLKQNIYEIIYNGSPDILMSKFMDHNIPLIYKNERWVYSEK